MTQPSVIKLKNGEMIIASIQQNEDVLLLNNPIAIVPVPVMQGNVAGETFVMKPWIGISNDVDYLISLDEVLTTCSLKENLLEQYNKYVGIPTPEIEEPADELEMLQARILRSRGLLN